MYRLLSYYGYTKVEDPSAMRDAQRELCESLDIQGRIYIAKEGINGTCAGSPDAIRVYQERTHEMFGAGIVDFKEEAVDRIPFADLRARVRPWLVNLGEGNNVLPEKEGGKRLRPADWKAFMESGRKFTMLDVRNDYEAEIGHFRGALAAPYKNFHEFPKWVEELELDPDEPVLMYCTGGIRCEKFSGLLTRKGHREVYQLDGGILRYAEEVGGDHFLGNVFVFDDRMSVDIGGEETPGRCIHCGAQSARMINCANVDCHTLHVTCDDCVRKTRATCSPACLSAPRLREFKDVHLTRPWRRLAAEDVKDAGAEEEGFRAGAE